MLLENICYINFTFSCIGKSRNLLFFEFEKFAIGRYVEAEVKAELENQLLPSLPFQRMTKQDGYSRQREIFDKNANNFIIGGVMPFKYNLFSIS